jgi:hypothetical protein|tara:strand:- start:4 stop:234 length:231 start_codon:yes stop_codon:yes gene_type:complete
MTDFDVSRGYHIYRDGNMWCAVGPHFRNLQESDAAFGPTPIDALNEFNKIRFQNGESSVHLFDDRVKVHNEETLND